jgi:hypothetical protein
MSRSWQPPLQTGRRNFVRTGAKSGETVFYERPPTINTFTGYTGVAAEHLKREEEYLKRQAENLKRQREQRSYEQERAKHPKQEETRQREQQKAQSPKRRSKSPSEKRRASPPPKPIPGCPSSGRNPEPLRGHDNNAKRKHFYDQARIFHPDNNPKCPDKDKEKVNKKMQDLLNFKAQANIGGGKSKRVSKRASKRTTKKRSGK